MCSACAHRLQVPSSSGKYRYMHAQTAIDDCYLLPPRGTSYRRQLCVVVDTLCFRHVPAGLKLPDSDFLSASTRSVARSARPPVHLECTDGAARDGLQRTILYRRVGGSFSCRGLIMGRQLWWRGMFDVRAILQCEDGGYLHLIAALPGHVASRCRLQVADPPGLDASLQTCKKAGRE